MRKYLCAALSPQTCKKRLRTASAVSVSAELSMIAQTSEQRTLLTFCSAFAKCPKYGERLGAITQGEDLTSGTLQRAAQIDLLSRRRRGGLRAFAACECGAGSSGRTRLRRVNAARAHKGCTSLRRGGAHSLAGCERTAGTRGRRLQHIYDMTSGFFRLHAGDRKLGIAPAPVQWEAHLIKPCERHCLTDRPAVRREHR